MPSNKKLLQAAAGNAGESLYVEDVFSTYLYTGNGSTQTITNGIDLSGEGGLVWRKQREAVSGGFSHNVLVDTERGASNAIFSDLTDQQYSLNAITSFNSNGFSVTDNNGAGLNLSGKTYASWTFREAEKFCSIVTYTGNSVNGRQLPHNLGSTPGMVVCKRTDTGQNWILQHRSLDLSGNKTMYLNSTDALAVANDYWNSTHASDTAITLSGNADINGTGGTYVAYVFAHNAGGFGDDGSENIIKCGSYTGNGNYTTGNAVNVGFEPQWLLIKNASRAHSNSDWVIYDVMRGYTGTNQAQAGLFANLSNAETTSGGKAYNSFITSSGFHLMDSNEAINFNGDTYIYIAIRRPMKTPESGTEVFAPISLGTTTEPGFVSNFVTDFTIHRTVNEVGSRQVSSRMTGNKYMFSNATNAEGSISAIQWDFMNGSRVGNGTANANEIQWMFKRATGFMDAVAYSGTGSSLNPVHNLGVTPELKIIKCRSNSGTEWVVGGDIITGGTTNDYIVLDSNAAKVTNSNYWTSGADSATTFSTRTSNGFSNSSGRTYIAYLFASVAGVSKVGSVAHSGTTNVDCGFSAGARFVLVKRTDSSGDWYVWDSLRGISASTDPYLLLNSTAAEVTNTDYIDPLSSGFTLTSSFTAGTYIFLAIA